LEAGTAWLANHGSSLTPMDDWYDLGPIGGGEKALEYRWLTKKSINPEFNVSIVLTAYTNFLGKLRIVAGAVVTGLSNPLPVRLRSSHKFKPPASRVRLAP